MTPLLQVAAIDFLNPAPLMWNFEHPPAAAALAGRYAIEKMTPAECARALGTGTADLGLIPIGAYAAIPGLAVVPGCAIASLGAIRSLLLVLRTGPGEAYEPGVEASAEPDLASPTPGELARIHSVALDTSSRTTALYTQILFRRFWNHTPVFITHPPSLDAMLATADAAVLIGDPALHALHDRSARLERSGERLRYLDLGHLWHQATGTAWVSAFWAVRSAGLDRLRRLEREQIVADLQASRDAGLANIPALVAEWAPRLGLPGSMIATYLTRNIHYQLDASAIAGVERFFSEASALSLVPAFPTIEWMTI